jgi:hypothetical protein
LQPLLRTLLAIDLFVVTLLLALCFWGAIDGRASIFNGTFWLVLLAVPGALTAAGVAAWRHGRQRLALLLLLLAPALPAAMATAVLLVLHAHPGWR